MLLRRDPLNSLHFRIVVVVIKVVVVREHAAIGLSHLSDPGDMNSSRMSRRSVY